MITIQPNISIEKTIDYIYVCTRTELVSTDISIFTFEEWENLSDISKDFDNCIKYMKEIGYDKVPLSIQNASHFFYYSPFCYQKRIRDLDFCTGNEFEIYREIYKKLENSTGNKRLSVNKFRKWLSSMNCDIQINHEKIKIYLEISSIHI